MSQAAPEAGDAELLYGNDRRARRVRWVVAGAAAYCAVIVSIAWGEEAPLSLMLAALGVVPLAGIVLYARLYLEGIERRGDFLRLTAVGVFSPSILLVDARDVRALREHDWPLEPGSPVRTRHLALHVAGRRLPYVVDLAAEHIDRRALGRLARRESA